MKKLFISLLSLFSRLLSHFFSPFLTLRFKAAIWFSLTGLGTDGWKCISQSHLCQWSLFLTGGLVIAVKRKKHKVAVFTAVIRELSSSAAALPLPATGSNFSRNMIWWISLNRFSLAAHQTAVWPVPVLPSPHTANTAHKEQSNAAASACVCTVRFYTCQKGPGQTRRMKALSLSLSLSDFSHFLSLSLSHSSSFLSFSFHGVSCVGVESLGLRTMPDKVWLAKGRRGLWLNWQEDHRLEGAHVLHIFPNK